MNSLDEDGLGVIVGRLQLGFVNDMIQQITNKKPPRMANFQCHFTCNSSNLTHHANSMITKSPYNNLDLMQPYTQLKHGNLRGNFRRWGGTCLS